MNKIYGIALAVGLLLTGCTSAGSDGPQNVTNALGIRWHDCPAEVELALTTKHRCGTLTVPLDHARPEEATTDLAVVQVWPTDAGQTPGGDVALSVGFNFGEPRQATPDMLALAERIGVPVMALAPRGLGEQGALSLDCPEVDGLDTGATAEPDSAARSAFVEAVTACRNRLTDDGIDPELFGIDDIAEDVESLRSTLEVEQWFLLISYGELSRVSDAYAASYRERVRAIVEDSPAPGGRDSFAAKGEGLRSALDALFAECADDPVCVRRYPDLYATWRQALDRVAARPLTGPGADGEVLVDAPRFLRAVKAMLGNGPVFVPDLPRIITTAAAGQLHPTLNSIIASDLGYCLGHRPVCTKPAFSMGAYLSQACPELGIGDAAEDNQLYRQTFIDSPYVDACHVWDIAASTPPPTPTNVPILVLTGQLDSWSRPEWFDDAATVRGAAHDVASSADCVFDVRNPWIADPTTAPDTRPCDDEPFPAWD